MVCVCVSFFFPFHLLLGLFFFFSFVIGVIYVHTWQADIGWFLSWIKGIVYVLHCLETYILKWSLRHWNVNWEGPSENTGRKQVKPMEKSQNCSRTKRTPLKTAETNQKTSGKPLETAKANKNTTRKSWLVLLLPKKSPHRPWRERTTSGWRQLGEGNWKLFDVLISPPLELCSLARVFIFCGFIRLGLVLVAVGRS